ncbi:MAG: DoxX family protein [Cyclobacteriaceae bacterium]
MSQLHEIEIGKTRRVIGYVLSILVSLMLLFSGVMKIIGVPEMAENMAKIPNIGEMVTVIGVIELVSLALYWIPKTSNLGFFLLCSYAGGIIVGEIVTGEPPIPGTVVAVLLYVSTFLRKPSLSGLGI